MNCQKISSITIVLICNKFELKRAEGKQCKKAQLEPKRATMQESVVGNRRKYVMDLKCVKIHKSSTGNTNLMVYNSLVSLPCICNQSLQRYTSTFSMMSMTRDPYLLCNFAQFIQQIKLLLKRRFTYSDLFVPFFPRFLS